MNEPMVFDESLEEWRARTDGTAEQWRARASQMWHRIKTGPHWHDGQTCAEVKCRGSRPS